MPLVLLKDFFYQINLNEITFISWNDRLALISTMNRLLLNFDNFSSYVSCYATNLE